MRTRQLVSALMFVAVIGGCGSSSTPAGTGGSGGVVGTAGDGGTSTGGTGGTGGMPNLAMCGDPGNTCTKSETDNYNACLVNRCETAYKPCIGEGWRTGQFSGACGPWFKCLNDCGCDDTACSTACGLPPAACLSCLASPIQCQTSMCPQPACYNSTSGPDGGFTFPDAGYTFPDGGITLPDSGLSGGTCADLKACCDSIADPGLKTSCNSAYTQAMMAGDGPCSVALVFQKFAGNCQ